MLTVGQNLPEFQVTGVKPGFQQAEQNGESAFEALTQDSFNGQWKIIYFYPKDFTTICPQEIIKFDKLYDEFASRSAVIMGGNTDNEHCKLAWRRENKDLSAMKHWLFSDSGRVLIDALGIFSDKDAAVLRATFIADPDNVIQHVSVNPVATGRDPAAFLRVLDGLQL